ncbi:MAG: DUF898 family protein [Paracoccaceae bacterium]|nr:DUF898 family protein [Paracoccaceae bacterium]
MSDQAANPGLWQPAPSNTIEGHYTGEGGPLFRLAAVTSFLTLITLGIYRFWARTRVRRYIWSSTTAGGDTFQYTGTGLEKLLGFLVAVVILAFALGALQIGLFFLNLSLFSPRSTEEDFAVQIGMAYLSLLLLAPLFFVARYRSLRYKLSRTRWRGVRFGMDNEAWGYALRGVGLTLLTLVTLGLMLPYQTYTLTKYRTDRMWFGNARFALTGRWQSLYPALIHIMIGVGMVIVGIVFIAVAAQGSVAAGIAGGVLAGLGYIWAIIGGLYYRVDSFRRLTAMTVLDGRVSFAARLGTGDILWRLFAGGFIVGGVYSLAIGIVTWLLTSSLDIDVASPELSPAIIAVNVLIILIALLLISALSMVLIVQPIVRLVVDGVTVENADALDRIRQRAEDEQVDADGLADALDFGGAI